MFRSSTILYLVFSLSLLTLTGCGGGDDHDDVIIINPHPSTFVTDAWFVDEVDIDADGFSSKFRLVWEADCECGSMSVYADLYYKETGTSGWFLFGSTRTYTITGRPGQNDYSVLLNGDFHGAYDYRIELFTGDGFFLDALDHSLDVDLHAHREETPEEDLVAQSFGYFFEAWIDDEVDGDLDGFPSEFTINWDADSTAGEMNVFVDILYRESGTVDWFLLATTETYRISGTDWEDSFYVLVEGGPRGFYDYLLVLYREDGLELDWVDPSVMPELGTHPEELPEED